MTPPVAATLRVQRYSGFDSLGAGTEAGPLRLTHKNLIHLSRELENFEAEMEVAFAGRFDLVGSGAYLSLEGGRILMVARFVGGSP